MRIVIYSSTFLPNIGGLENIMSGLASEWSNLGHEVIVATRTAGNEEPEDQKRYSIVRKPTYKSLFKLANNAEIFIEANISLKTALIGLFFYRKWIVIHHLPYSHQSSITGFFKNLLTLFSNNIAVSEYIAKSLVGKSAVIHNFYHPDFKNLKQHRKPNSLLFVGRLVSDKGVFLLINALITALNTIASATLTIVGEGEEKESLINYVKKNNLKTIVSFSGNKNRSELIKAYNEHEIVVIPSIWEEPFGLVALEALACGCKLVYANAGGLPEAAGDNGIPFNRNNLSSLEEAIIKTLELGNKTALEASNEFAHLSSFNIGKVSNEYLTIFKSMLKI